MSHRDTVLVTGGSGFIGRNISPILEEEYEVVIPSRKELDLRDRDAVARYIIENDVRYIVNSANPNPVKNSAMDSESRFFEDSLRVFMHIFEMRDYVDRIIYFGSGAEFDKSMDISNVVEEEAGRSLPSDSYGCAKYIMNKLASQSHNVVNLRLFGCYGPTDHSSKFITHCINCVKRGSAITIRQDCRFDYLHVFDVGKVVLYFLAHQPEHSDYNVASGVSYLLSEITKKVGAQMGFSGEFKIENEGLNREYTADVHRLRLETGLVDTFIGIDEGISMQIESEGLQQ